MPGRPGRGQRDAVQGGSVAALDPAGITLGEVVDINAASVPEKTTLSNVTVVRVFDATDTLLEGVRGPRALLARGLVERDCRRAEHPRAAGQEHDPTLAARVLALGMTQLAGMRARGSEDVSSAMNHPRRWYEVRPRSGHAARC